MNLGTGGGMSPGKDGAGMHRTDTIDLVVVLEGETNVAYPGEDGNVYEITIKAGDFLTHSGTFHRWHNRSTSNCTLMLITLTAERKTEERPARVSPTSESPWPTTLTSRTRTFESDASMSGGRHGR